MNCDTYTIRPYKDKNKPQYTHVVSFYKDGKRTSRKLCKSEQQAQGHVNEVNLVGKGSPDVLKTISRNVTDDVLERLKKVKVSIGDALLFAIEHYEAQQKQAPTCQQVYDMFYEQNKANRHSPRHLRDIESRCKIILNLYSDTKIHLVTTEMVNKAMKKWGQLHPVTWNSQLAVLRNYFSYAVQEKLISENPALFVRRMKTIKQRPAILTIEQFNYCLEYNEPQIVLWCGIAGLAGIRSAELTQLTWKDINLEKQSITIDYSAAKLRQIRHIPIYPRLKTILQNNKNDGRLFWKDFINSKKYRSFKKDYTKKFGVKFPNNGLRHSFASYHADAFDNGTELWKIMGHVDKPDTLLDHYRNIVPNGSGKEYFGIIEETKK